ncbi:hypothetical protein MPER_12820 [Moniliophthora perniciosa FA553]|nr:hypothetical protein MPER_12820 [Moniliophthora perniciosa FA553]
MDDTLSDFIAEGWCCVYMDDILIFSQNKESHRIRTRQLLKRLADQDLFLKPEKCEFDVTEVNFLGMIIRPGHVAMDSTKLAGIKDWLPPDSVTGVRSFLGFGNFYRKFIRKFGEIAKPLNDLTKKGAAFIWSKECQLAFDALKRKFLKEPILIIPDLDKPFLLETDASKWASGGVLRQKGPDGEWHPCGYISHSFNQAERNYQIYDRELLAMIWALKEWRHYLMGGKFPFVILSDHDNLRYFRKPQDLNPRQARWLLFLSEFNFKMVHTPGKQLIQADALLRRPDHVMDKDENQHTTLLPDHLFINSVHFELESEIRDKLSNDDFHKAALESLLHDGVTPIKSALSDWEIDNDIIKFRGKTYVPDDLETRRRVVKEIHESFRTEHPGQYLTQELVQRSYWWPGLAKFVKNFVDGCIPCQQMKINTHPTRTPLIPIPGTPNALPFQVCTMDLITDLPEVDGFDSIMVVVDHSSTKGVIFTPCTKTLNAEGAAKLLLDNLYRRFGLPDKLISDRDPRFAAEVFQEMGRLLGIKHSMTTAYHPQSDGETERVNQEIEVFLRMFCAKEQTMWKDFLGFAEFAHNNRTHSTMKLSPFHMMMGYDPRPLPTAFGNTNVPSVENRLREIKRIREEVSSLMEIAGHQMIR